MGDLTGGEDRGATEESDEESGTDEHSAGTAETDRTRETDESDEESDAGEYTTGTTETDDEDEEESE